MIEKLLIALFIISALAFITSIIALFIIQIKQNQKLAINAPH